MRISDWSSDVCSSDLNTPSHIELLGGSWDRWRIEGQLAGALNTAGTVHVIGVAVHEESGSFMQRIDSAKTVLYAGIDADLTPELTAYLHGGYERYRGTSFDGNPTLPDGTPAPVGRPFRWERRRVGKEGGRTGK